MTWWQILLIMLAGAVVVIIATGAAFLVAHLMSGSDTERHRLDREAAERRHKELKDAIDGQATTLHALVSQYGRLDRTAVDHRAVLEDHADVLEELLPTRRARRPDPKPL